MVDDASGGEVSLVPDANFWEVRLRGRYSGGPLLRGLAAMLPPGLTLYLEGTSIAPIVQAYLADRSVADPMPVKRGVIWPKPKVFHTPMTPENVAGLAELMEHLAAPEVGDHAHAYKGTEAHLIWYDAWFDSPMYIRNTVPAEAVRRLCEEFEGDCSPVTD